ncbi:MAG: hypothetical protein AB7E47_06565 [Desulfovibrionaceae bacterium]
MQWKNLDLEDLARLFGAAPEELARHCHEEIASVDLHYSPLGSEERDALLLRILKTMDEPALPVAGESRKPDWERGWRENLDDFIASGHDVRALVPKYYRKRAPARLFGDYVMPRSDDFVFNVTHIFRLWLFKTYFTGKRHFFEFGCGSGQHVAFLASLFPGAACTGLDWARPSQEIIAVMAEKTGWDVRGRNFDFFNPDKSIDIPDDSAVFTFGALEQTGANHGAFLDMLIEKAPAICVNIEGLHELYDQDNFTDYLAFRYHMRRGYLRDYLTRLRQEEAKGRVAILAVHHQRFGNIFDDPHSYVIWRPIA